MTCALRMHTVCSVSLNTSLILQHICWWFILRNEISLTKVQVKILNSWRRMNSVIFAPDPFPPFISVSIASYISMLDLLRCFILQIAFSLQKKDSPSWLIKMLAVTKKRPWNLRKQTPAVNQKWFRRMITDGMTGESAPTNSACPGWFTHFPSCCLHFSKIACSPLWMQIKNMAWDQFWRVYALTDRWRDGHVKTEITAIGSQNANKTWNTGCKSKTYLPPLQDKCVCDQIIIFIIRDSPHCRGASCRCSRTSWLRTPSTLASPLRRRDGWVWLRTTARITWKTLLDQLQMKIRKERN